MKKIFIAFFLFFLSISYVFSGDSRKISIFYNHSRRIPYNIINIDIGNYRGEYFIKYETFQMQNKKGYENTNTTGKIIITKEYFDRLYDDFITVDFKDIVFRNLNVLGFDGSTVALEIGSYINTIKLSIWSPNYDSINRGTVRINELFMKVFENINLSGYYNN